MNVANTKQAVFGAAYLKSRLVHRWKNNQQIKKYNNSVCLQVRTIKENVKGIKNLRRETLFCASCIEVLRASAFT